MSGKFVHEARVDYSDVDRDERLLLSGFFKLLQEAAIQHANRFDTGVTSLPNRGESWILNRLAVHIAEYPVYGAQLRVETWSRGIISFRGFREYRVFCGNKLLASGTALWVYFNVAKKALAKVPEDVVAAFPQVEEGPFQAGIERFTTPTPDPRTPTLPITVRYGDVDANDHINNTAYFDYLQTALIHGREAPRPARLFIRFVREIPPEARQVEVSIESSTTPCLFAIAHAGQVCAQGSFSSASE